MLDPVESIEWPSEPTISSLGQAIGAMRGITVRIQPIPARLQNAQVSGLVIVVDRTAHVYFDSTLSRLNQMQTIMHEFAHILHGDVTTCTTSSRARNTCADTKEARAEATGTRLLTELMARRTRRNHRDVLDFLDGSERDR